MIKGETYQIPTIKGRTDDRWIPVILPGHTDPELNVPEGKIFHYHIDYHFVTDKPDHNMAVIGEYIGLQDWVCLNPNLEYRLGSLGVFWTVRNLIGNKCAVNGKCPHKGATLLPNGLCPAHGMHFDSKGACIHPLDKFTIRTDFTTEVPAARKVTLDAIKQGVIYNLELVNDGKVVARQPFDSGSVVVDKGDCLRVTLGPSDEEIRRLHEA